MSWSEQQRSIKCVEIGVLAGSLALLTKVVKLWIRIAPRGGVLGYDKPPRAGGGCALSPRIGGGAGGDEPVCGTSSDEAVGGVVRQPLIV